MMVPRQPTTAEFVPMSVRVALATRAKVLLVCALGVTAASSGVLLASAEPRSDVLATAPQPAGSTASTDSGQSETTNPLQIPISFEIRPSKIVKVGPSAEPPSAVAAPIGPPGVAGEMGIPLMALQAYKRAAEKVKVEDPSCNLPWWLLAGIGHTESGHAESGRLYADGTTRGRILGPRLDGGIAGDAVIRDTDHGRYDGDTSYDRAVGPMQFIPSTWVHWAVDGNGDGKSDPNNIFDATLAAGHYLCADGRDLATPAGLQAAILSYNHSQPYLQAVLAWALAYRTGAIGVATITVPVVTDVTKVRPPLSSRPPQPKLTISTHPTPTRSSSSPPPTSSAPPTTACPTPSGSSTSPNATASQTVTATASDSASASESGTSSSAVTTSPSATPTSTTPSGCPS
jgi:membrane-bound lytic murein transglycosylase B